jgi:hypothetical protein
VAAGAPGTAAAAAGGGQVQRLPRRAAARKLDAVQIAFLTLLLGLVNGAQTVEISAGPAVVAVEVVLDGRTVARLGRAPWQARVDFGSALLPHHLEARGLDASGGEVARAEQWVNLPGPPAKVEIALEGPATGRKRTARIAWESLSGEPPEEVRLSLDGAPLALDGQGRARLELPEAGAAHVLSAELRFAGGARARKDVVLTGDYGGDVATELTAVPVRAPGAGGRGGRGGPLAVQDVQGRLLVNGQSARVTAVEQEPPEVFVVRAWGAETFLYGRAMRVGRSAYEYAHFKPDPRIRFHFVSTAGKRATNAARARSSELFDVSPGLHHLDNRFDLLRVLLAVRHDAPSAPGRQQLADAVAVAGLHAIAGQTPRAVLLVGGRGDGTADTSLFLPAAVRGYLAAAGVPLFVWSTSSGKGSLRQEDWGPIEDVSTPAGIASAYRRLAGELAAQQIVWVEGRHLPQAVRLAPAAGATGGAGGAGREVAAGRQAADAAAGAAGGAVVAGRGPAAAGTDPAAAGLELVAVPPASP